MKIVTSINIMAATCFMCENLATSVEHVPPKCIFPERKDTLVGIDYRKDLITVPSCYQHNSARSKDDEYFLYVLAASITSGDIGLNQFLTKVKRALERNPRLIENLQVSPNSAFNYVTKAGHRDEAFPIVAQGDRIDRVITSCARALYFHEYGVRFVGEIKAEAAFLPYMDSDSNKTVAKMFFYAKDFFQAMPTKGANKDIFYYQFAKGKNSAFILMCFYQGTEFLVRFLW